MAFARISSALLLIVASPWGADSSQASPVQKVLQLIDEFTAKVTSEDDETKKEFESFAKICDDESSEKNYAIKNSKEQIEDLAASMADSAAGIETETSKVSDISATISATEKELTEVNALRDKEHADFVAAEKELLDTVDSCAGAQEMLKKSLALIQSRGGSVSQEDQQAVNAIAQSLGQIAEAAFVTTQQRDKIQAFFQEKEDADDALTFRTHAMGGGGSDAILDTLQEMEDKASDSLSKTRNDESQAANAHALMKQSLENEIKNGKKELAEATHLKAVLTEKLAQAEKDSATEKKGLSSDEAYLRDLKRDCQTRASEFEVEAKDTDAELTALAKAKGILTKKFAASFVEMKSKTHLQVRYEEDDVRAQALRVIEQVGKKYHSTALVSLAYRAAADPFEKVRGMIEDMIAKLLQEAAEEANQKAFCDKEMGESKAQQADKEGKLDKINARLGQAVSNSAALSEEIVKLSKEVAENDAAVATATAQRDEEKALFGKVEKDLSESEEACAAAISVLREYYEGASLLQVSSQTNAEAADKTEDGGGIISVLEVAESDFANSLAEVRSVETRAVDEFDKMMQDSKLLKVTKEMEIKGKESEVKSLKTTISDNSEDKAGLTDELDAVLAYLDKLKPQCETKVPSYAEIKAKREAEIQGLKEALEVLSGTGAPGFLQTSLRGNRA